jgi:hypothetical protein
MKINTLSGKYINSQFDISGNIDTGDSRNPFMDLAAKLNLKIQDTFIFLPNNLVENLRKLKLDGKLNIAGSLTGKAKDYKAWSISAQTTSDLISVYNLKFTDLSFNLQQQDGTLYINRFGAAGYSGTINIGFVSNLKTDTPNYVIKFNSNGIDLAKLKLDMTFKDKDITGILDINADLNGNFKDLGALKGAGSVSIKNGKLWQLNLFKGLAELFLIVDYEKIIFKDAMGDFEIENKYVLTDDFRMKSEQLTWDYVGKIGFDGSLNFTIYSQANKELIKDSPDIRKFLTAIVGELSSAIAIKLSGTIQKPKYHIIPLPLDLIRNIKDFFLGK